METISLQGIVSFFILGRQWTDGNGNTYFANKIFIGGEDTPDIDDCLRISPILPRTGLLHCTRWSYGYGEQWLEDAADILLRYLTVGEEGHGLRELRDLCEDKGVLLITDCATVRSKRELKEWTQDVPKLAYDRSYKAIARPLWAQEVCRAL